LPWPRLEKAKLHKAATCYTPGCIRAASSYADQPFAVAADADRNSGVVVSASRDSAVVVDACEDMTAAAGIGVVRNP